MTTTKTERAEYLPATMTQVDSAVPEEIEGDETVETRTLSDDELLALLAARGTA